MCWDPTEDDDDDKKGMKATGRGQRVGNGESWQMMQTELWLWPQKLSWTTFVSWSTPWKCSPFSSTWQNQYYTFPRNIDIKQVQGHMGRGLLGHNVIWKLKKKVLPFECNGGEKYLFGSTLCVVLKKGFGKILKYFPLHFSTDDPCNQKVDGLSCPTFWKGAAPVDWSMYGHWTGL